MQTTEQIKVFVEIINGKTVCICHAGRKGCSKPCQRDVVTRDKFRDWKGTMHKNKYGK